MDYKLSPDSVDNSEVVRLLFDRMDKIATKLSNMAQEFESRVSRLESMVSMMRVLVFAILTGVIGLAVNALMTSLH